MTLGCLGLYFWLIIGLVPRPAQVEGADVTASGADRSSWSPWTWPPDRWIALSSVVVSLFAVGLSIYQGQLEREHKKLSVRPHVLIGFNWENDEAGWTLLNAGLGPAEIRWFAVSVDGKHRAEWRDVLKVLGLGEPSYQWVFYPGDVKPAGQEPTKLVRFKRSSLNFDSMMAARRRATVEVCYCSMYGECWRVKDVVGSHRAATCDVRPPVVFTAPQ